MVKNETECRACAAVGGMNLMDCTQCKNYVDDKYIQNYILKHIKCTIETGYEYGGELDKYVHIYLNNKLITSFKIG